MERTSFIFYSSFYEAAKHLPAKQRHAVYDAVIEFAITGIEPNLSGVPASIFELIRPQIEANNKKYQNGRKGGRPKNQDETDKEPRRNQGETKAKPNVNENENDNVNENVLEEEEDDAREAQIILDKFTQDYFKPNRSQKQTIARWIGMYGFLTVDDVYSRMAARKINDPLPYMAEMLTHEKPEVIDSG